MRKYCKSPIVVEDAPVFHSFLRLLEAFSGDDTTPEPIPPPSASYGLPWAVPIIEDRGQRAVRFLCPSTDRNDCRGQEAPFSSRRISFRLCMGQGAPEVKSLDGTWVRRC